MKIEEIEPSANLMTGPNELAAAFEYIEYAARTCYQSTSKMSGTSSGQDTFLCKLIDSGHLGPFEFGSMAFEVTTSRAIANEIVRHRLFSYCQESTRYVNYVKKGYLRVITPSWAKETVGGPAMHQAFLDTCQNAADAYSAFVITRHVHPEDARDILPLTTATTICISGNFREWRHFFELRTAPAAHKEIRDLAEQMRSATDYIAADWELPALKSIFHRGIDNG